MPRPKNIRDHLNSGSGELHSLLSRVEHLNRLDRALQNLLGEPLGSHCRLANIRGETAILQADSPVWSARLRYQLPQILSALNQHHRDAHLSRAEILVKPVTQPASQQGASPKISSRTGQLLKNVAAATADDRLRASLLRLAARARE